MTLSAKPKVSQVSQNVHLLEFEDERKVYLVGTAHVSAASVELVENTINEIEPDTICIELDEKRFKSMREKIDYSNIDIIEIIKKGQFFFFIGQLLLSSFQKKISKQTGSKPGEEFRRAYELAEERGARLVLADREVGVTLKRAWRLTRFWDKTKLLFTLLFSDSKDTEEVDIESLKSMDAIEGMTKSFAEELPDTKRALIDERDTYLAYEIQKGAGQKTVAVVGAGHVPGILKNLEEDIPLGKKEEISHIPPASKVGKIIPWIIPVVIISLFIWGLFNGKIAEARTALLYWVLANGILTAIGTLLALGHPLTILVGFIAAPITSLNPTIGAGFVTAIAQTYLVKPRVKDFEQVNGENLGIKGWFTNRLTKVLLVFIFSSLGSTIGTFVAFPALKALVTG